jgi:hypothetical protein
MAWHWKNEFEIVFRQFLTPRSMSTANINTLPDNSHYGKIITYRRHAKSIVTGKRKAGLLAQSVRDGREIPVVITEIAKSLPSSNEWDGCHVKWYHGGEKSRWLPDVVTPLTQLVCLAEDTKILLRYFMKKEKLQEEKILKKGEVLQVHEGTYYKILPIPGKRLIFTYRQSCPGMKNIKYTRPQFPSEPNAPGKMPTSAKTKSSILVVKPEEEPYDLSIFD